MFGFVIAGLSALGLVLLARRRHRFGPTGWFLRRLEASPAQEKIVREATREARQALADLRQDVRESRGQLADCLTQETFEEAQVDAWLNARRDAFERVKPRLLAALKSVHETLDSEQRQKLSRWVQRGGAGAYGAGWHHGCSRWHGPHTPHGCSPQ